MFPYAKTFYSFFQERIKELFRENRVFHDSYVS